jgi:hypothetical protein
MLRKLIAICGLLLSLNTLLIGCSNDKLSSSELTLEQSIKEIIISKGEGYDFLTDEAYMSHINELGKELVVNKNAEPPHYSVGNLDEDNIPEIAVFKQRDPNNVDDEGSLEIYKFDGEKYSSIDSISMNFDNTNYQIEIGQISEKQSGLFLANQVGAHSGVTYGYILENGKLKNILDEKKISLISAYTSNEIKDIDNDGVLEFSIYTIDPETEDSSSAGSDKMTLWYKWNGKDSANIIEIERENYSNLKSNKKIFEESKIMIDNNFSETLSFIKENQDRLSKFDNAELLMKYINKLNEISYDKSVVVEDLFIIYQKDDNFDYLFKKYGLDIDKLNNLDYLKREKVLKDEENLKEDIINNINLGYKLDTSEGIYYYLIDYQMFIDNFEENITNEFLDYLRILALDTNEPFLNDGSLVISMDKLAERILLTESFKMIYPYSNFVHKVDDIYINYLYTYLYGDNHDPNFDIDTFTMKEKVLKHFEETIEKYNYTHFSDILQNFKENLNNNNNIINDEIRAKVNERLN